MIKFYELNESEVISATGLAPGAYICCKDSGNIYMVPTSGTEPIKLASQTIFLTDSERVNLLAPINGKFYYCTDTGGYWIYYNTWTQLNASSGSFDIEPVILTNTGTVTVTDSRIKAGMTGTFIPDYSVNDLVTNIAVAVTNGSATVTGTTSYDIPGKLKFV